MEVDDIQLTQQTCKFPRIIPLGQKGEDEEENIKKRAPRGGGKDKMGEFCGGGGWGPSSRIVRVSRASGGKDRHSKVWTSRGLRDRRVRLSVTTAIQFYDLQDRLGYDQPSKAVEWLLKAASTSIDELPSLTSLFPDTPKQQLSDDNRMDPSFHNVSLSKSACSSTSETSKGSGGLSLSRSESRIKARERARGRAAEKGKDKETDTSLLAAAAAAAAGHVNSINSQNSSSFTELLTGNGAANNKSNRQWSSPPMDYFASGHMMVPPFSISPGDHHHQQQELQQFSFVPDNLVVPVNATGAGGNNDYNLNFSISSGLAGFNRGTLQSNSPSLLPPHIQRFSPIDGSSNSSFFLGNNSTTPSNADSHHQFPAGFDGRLHLYYGGGEADRHSDHKGKAKH